MVKLYYGVLGDNCVFELLGTPTRDSNILKIHSNNEGRDIYCSYDIHDIDVMRIVRILSHMERMYNRWSTEKICNLLNKECEYLYIDVDKLR